ncbi:hypothetical protein B0H13DRAFT_2345819 [Mycena leptocephala]|nr:hypothetical protein B0H13DRAFT_2345819 [Mycena leptocephala]
MLVATDDGGPGEVYHVMEKAPVSWGPILIMENITSTLSLYSKVVEHEPALIEAARSEHSHTRAITADNLAATLKAMGYSPEKTRYSTKQVHFNSGESTKPSESQKEEGSSQEAIEVDMEDKVFRQVYATLKAKRRPDPPGGYPFPKNDHVVTKLGKMPPGPCRLCGSEKHWNRECSNYVVYSEGMKRSANFSSVTEPTEEETMCQSLFMVLLNQTLSKATVDFGTMNGSFFEQAALKTNVSRRKTAATEKESGFPDFEMESKFAKDNRKDLRISEQYRKVTMEEIPDKEETDWSQKPKAERGIIEPLAEENEESGLAEEVFQERDWESGRRAREARKINRLAEEFWLNDGRMFPKMDSKDEEDEGDESAEEEDMISSAFLSGATESSPMEGDDDANKQSQSRLDPPRDLIPT